MVRSLADRLETDFRRPSRNADAAPYLVRPIGPGRRSPNPVEIADILAALRGMRSQPRSRAELAAMLERVVPADVFVSYSLRRYAEETFFGTPSP